MPNLNITLSNEQNGWLQALAWRACMFSSISRRLQTISPLPRYCCYCYYCFAATCSPHVILSDTANSMPGRPISTRIGGFLYVFSTRCTGCRSILCLTRLLIRSIPSMAVSAHLPDLHLSFCSSSDFFVSHHVPLLARGLGPLHCRLQRALSGCEAETPALHDYVISCKTH